MKINNLLILVALFILLSGCNTDLFGTDRPEGISKKYYDMFVESYEIYEKRVIKYNGNFLDENNELLEFEEGPPGALTSDIASTYHDDMKKIEDGKPEQVKLTEKENQLHGDFLELYSLKSWDFFNPDLKKQMLRHNPEYADLIKAAIELERKIINTLELDKNPVSLEIRVEEGIDDENQQNNADDEKIQRQIAELELKQRERELDEQDEQNKNEVDEKPKDNTTLSQYSEKEIEYVRVWLQVIGDNTIEELYVSQVEEGEPLNPYEEENSALYPDNIVRLSGDYSADGTVYYKIIGDDIIHVYNIPDKWMVGVEGEETMEEFTQNLINNPEEIHLDSMNDEEIEIMINKIVMEN